MATVFIVQEPLRTGMQRMFDFTPAAVYGDLKTLLPAGKPIFTPGPMVFELRQQLKNFTDDDYILAVGDPLAIGAACAIAAEFNHGKFRMLKWDRETRRYIEIRLNTKGVVHGARGSV